MSKQFYGSLIAVVLGGWGGFPAARGQELLTECPPTCEPGFMIVEDICYREVIRKVCRVVPEVQQVRRTVYSCKSEDYCLLKCPCPLGPGKQSCDGCCPQCEHPRRRNVLLKKEVVEEIPMFRCVVEEVVELVPFKVYRKVPRFIGPVVPHALPVPTRTPPPQ
jgi:hypothetical protein